MVTRWGGALKRSDPAVIDIKRMWLRSDVRGRGLGRALLGHLMDEARTLGVDRVRLDTNETLVEAIALRVVRFRCCRAIQRRPARHPLLRTSTRLTRQRRGRAHIVNLPAAVIFDFDGTIADTETPVYEAAGSRTRSMVSNSPWRHGSGRRHRRQQAAGREDQDELGRPGCRRDKLWPRNGTPPTRTSVLLGVEIDHGRRARLPACDRKQLADCRQAAPHRLVDHFDHLSRVIRSTEVNPPLTCSSSPRPDSSRPRRHPRHRGLATAMRQPERRGCAVVVPNTITAHDVHPDAEIVLESTGRVPLRSLRVLTHRGG